MQFTEEHEQFRKSLRRLIDEEINPHVDAWEEAGIFPAHAGGHAGQRGSQAWPLM